MKRLANAGLALVAVLCLSVFVAACGGDDDSDSGGSGGSTALKTSSDLKGKTGSLKITGYPECRQREDCLIGVQKAYGKFGGFVGNEKTYQVLDNKEADVGFLFTTDAQLSTGKYVTLEDDKKVFPPYNITLLMREKQAKALGTEGTALIEKIQKPLTNKAMVELNSRVVLDKQKPEKVAADYLKAEGFTSGANAIKKDPANASTAITVGSKNFPEQFVLGNIYADALEAAGFKVKRQLNIGSEVVAFKALRQGRIDAYPEYTGTALTALLGVKVADVPKDPQQAYDEVKSKAAKEGIVAFPRTPFENTFRLGLLKTRAEELSK